MQESSSSSTQMFIEINEARHLRRQSNWNVLADIHCHTVSVIYVVDDE